MKTTTLISGTKIEEDDTLVVDDILAKIWTRNTIREQLSTLSQIKFDKLNAVIDGADMLSLVPTADDQAPALPTGITNRDVLRTTLSSWKDAYTLHADNPRFIQALQLLQGYGIITATEVATLTGVST